MYWEINTYNCYTALFFGWELNRVSDYVSVHVYFNLCCGIIFVKLDYMAVLAVLYQILVYIVIYHSRDSFNNK